MSNDHISKIGVEYLCDSILFNLDGKFLESYDLNELFAIDETAITIDMATHSAKHGRIAVLLARAERYKALKKQQMEVEYAAADDSIRDEYNDDGKRYTESVIKAAVMLDEEYKMYTREYNDANNVVTVLKHILNAMKTKGDMLISIGAQLRAEMSMTGMVIKDDYDRTVASMKKKLSEKL